RHQCSDTPPLLPHATHHALPTPSSPTRRSSDLMRTHLSRGEHRTVIGCIGDESLLAELPLRSLPGVESVTPVLKPYKMASREFAADRTVVRVGGRDAHASFGGPTVTVIAGPCSVENRDMLRATATAVRQAGA